MSKKSPALPPPPGKDSPLSEREVYWRAHLTRWRASGLSQSEYSRQKGLRSNQLSYWHRRAQRLQASEQPVLDSGFVPLQVMTSGPQEGLTVRLASGVSIEGIRSETLLLATQLIAEL